MADIHDQALEWAQSNSQDPRAQDILAKAWAAKNPNDPRAAQITARFSGQPQASQAPQGPQLQEAPQGAPQSYSPQDVSRSQFKQAAVSGPDETTQRIMGGIFGGGVGEGAQAATTAMGAIASKVPGAIGKFLKPAAERSQVLSQVKNEAGLAPYVSERVGQAKQQFNQAEIAPRMNEQYARASEQTIPFNPGEFKGIHPVIDAHMDELAKSGITELPMKEALQLRAKLNDRSLFKDMGPYTPEIAAKQSAAVDAGNKLRSSLSNTDPNIGAISDELHQAYSLRDAATAGVGRRPVEAVQAPLGSTKASTLAQFDQKAGSDLRGLGENIQTAKSRLGESPTHIPHSVRGAIGKTVDKVAGAVPRGYDALAEFLQPAMERTSQELSTPMGGVSSLAALRAMIEQRKQGEQ